MMGGYDEGQVSLPMMCSGYDEPALPACLRKTAHGIWFLRVGDKSSALMPWRDWVEVAEAILKAEAERKEKEG